MFVHRYHLPYYQQVAVFFWPILFLELWRVDRWQAETGRRAFVTPDKYGRAWVPYFEGMSQKPHVNGVAAAVFKPEDITALCPGWFASARQSEPQIVLPSDPLDRPDVCRIPAGVIGRVLSFRWERLDPGWAVSLALKRLRPRPKRRAPGL